MWPELKPCGECGGQLRLLAWLGRLAWYVCRSCFEQFEEVEDGLVGR